MSDGMRAERERVRDAKELLKLQDMMSAAFRAAFSEFHSQLMAEKRRGFTKETSLEAARACVFRLTALTE
jgi:hypothetical protein